MTLTHGARTPAATTAVDGVLNTTFTADTEIGDACLQITYGEFPLTIQGDTLRQVPGPPVSATISSSLSAMPVGSDAEATLTLTFYDAWNSPH